MAARMAEGRGFSHNTSRRQPALAQRESISRSWQGKHHFQVLQSRLGFSGHGKLALGRLRPCRAGQSHRMSHRIGSGSWAKRY